MPTKCLKALRANDTPRADDRLVPEKYTYRR